MSLTMASFFVLKELFFQNGTDSFTNWQSKFLQKVIKNIPSKSQVTNKPNHLR